MKTARQASACRRLRLTKFVGHTKGTILLSSTLSRRPTIVGVGGLTSQVGKTTLVCDLLTAFPGWEAIKTTRGHYRSCGKDPHTCCVSDLLESEPVVRSGRDLTYTAGKDTGRYWDAGAQNVHWVVATDEQVEAGIKTALSRVEARGVFIEGNSFARFIETDYFVMVARPSDWRMKSTARSVLGHVSAIYFSGEREPGNNPMERALRDACSEGRNSRVPIFTPALQQDLFSCLRNLESPAFISNE